MKTNSDIDEPKCRVYMCCEKSWVVSSLFMTMEILLILFLVYKYIHCSWIHPMNNMRFYRNFRRK